MSDFIESVAEMRDAYRNERRALIARIETLEKALDNLIDDCLILAEGLNDYPPCTQTAISRNDASKKLKQYAADARSSYLEATKGDAVE